jgi:hypothetical protein
MAQTINNTREKIKTSIHGRRLGLDHTERLAGVKGTRKALTEATSATTGTALPNHGFVSVVTTTNDTWTLTDPEIGCEVMILTGTTSTGVHTITCAAATILSSVSSTGPGVTLTGAGAGFHLVGLTTALWGVTSRIGTTATSYVSSA